MNPLSSASLPSGSAPSPRNTEPAPHLVEQFANAMATTPATDADVMRQFDTVFKQQIVDQMIRDMQKWTRRLTGKD